MTRSIGQRYAVPLSSMSNPIQPRRFLLESAKKFLLSSAAPATAADPTDDFPRLTFKALERMRMSRSRERIMENLETMYREAFDRAKTGSDAAQMATLDFAYRREQLYLELLLDIRDAAERR